MQFSQDLKAMTEEREQGRNKRKRDSEDLPEEDVPSTSRRKTRSQGRKGLESEPIGPTEIADSEGDDDYQPGTHICGNNLMAMTDIRFRRRLDGLSYLRETDEGSRGFLASGHSQRAGHGCKWKTITLKVKIGEIRCYLHLVNDP